MYLTFTHQKCITIPQYIQFFDNSCILDPYTTSDTNRFRRCSVAIDSRLPGGFRDYLPWDMIPRQKMLDVIREVFERFGFVPLDTPGIEPEQVLTGGDPNFDKQIFRAGLRTLEEGFALRFDLTVPLARVVATYRNKLPRPFKRYQTGKVWRGEKPQAGRFREFVQFDADIVGTKSTQADAEIVALMYETMTALGFSNFIVRVNNRKILNGLAEYASFLSDLTSSVLRTIDKMDKIGWEGVSAELCGIIEGDVSGTSSGSARVAAIQRFIEIRGDNQDDTLRAVRKLMANSAMAQEGIQELEEILTHVRALGVPDEKWAIDLSVARGLGYYTGPVFETILTDLPSIGSVFSGGRYDDLVTRFDPNAIVPAVGASVGLDRLFAAMEKLSLVQGQETVTKVMVLNFDPTCSTACETLATALRRSGLATEIYLGAETSIKAQITFAVKQGVPLAIIIGEREKEAGTAQIKDLRARNQVSVSQNEVVETVRKLLNVS